MNDAHKIAVLGRDVHILYVAEMARNSGLLLLINTLGNPRKLNITMCRTKPLRGSLALFLQRHSILA
jgi:hypothetical protein